MRQGHQAPDFELPDENGTPRRLSDFLAKGPVVLYFYPAAMTPVCTAESCHFRDLKSEFEALGATRVGVSIDKVDKQKRFSEKYDFDFPLLSDSDAVVARAFGVHRNIGPLPTKRTTFVIGADGKVLEVIKSELRMSVHADKALEALRRPAA
ncbi:MAG: peroxiredoxin [Acidimicrobiales bacterium]